MLMRIISVFVFDKGRLKNGLSDHRLEQPTQSPKVIYFPACSARVASNSSNILCSQRCTALTGPAEAVRSWSG